MDKMKVDIEEESDPYTEASRASLVFSAISALVLFPFTLPVFSYLVHRNCFTESLVVLLMGIMTAFIFFGVILIHQGGRFAGIHYYLLMGPKRHPKTGRRIRPELRRRFAERLYYRAKGINIM